MKSSLGLACALAALGVASTMGCSGASDGSGFRGASSGAGGSAGGSGGSGGSGAGIIGGDGTGGTGQNVDPPCTVGDPNVDSDGDGFTTAQGDCNDCSAAMNPGAYDFAGDGVDEDCNGKVDDEPTGCDTGLNVAGDALAAAKAIGLCRTQQGSSWGLVSAKWVFPDGTTQSQPGGGFLSTNCANGGEPPNPESHGILGSFGNAIKPRDGASLLAMSSGVARSGNQSASQNGANGTSPDGAQMCTKSNTPPGFPVASTGCAFPPATDTTANDGMALELVIKTPTNAHQLSFDFDFYTYEFPNYVCSTYNDFFVALLQTKAPLDPKWNGNISFDSQGNPVSVNNGLVDVCQGPTSAGGKNFPCSLGPGEMNGTGFDDSGPSQSAATSWLNTKAGIVPGETITLRFAVWDAGDEVLDTTVLIDNFGWDVDEGSAPVTVPIPH